MKSFSKVFQKICEDYWSGETWYSGLWRNSVVNTLKYVTQSENTTKIKNKQWNNQNKRSERGGLDLVPRERDSELDTTAGSEPNVLCVSELLDSSTVRRKPRKKCSGNLTRQNKEETSDTTVVIYMM